MSVARLILLLRIGSFLCFAGWTWVHFYWQAPYGKLLWNGSVFSLVEKLGMGWDEFVGSGENDGLIQQLSRWIGWPYIACAILSLTVRKSSRWQMLALLGGCGLLVILSFAKFLAANQQLPMFVEHGGQMLMPAILVTALAKGVRHRTTVILTIVAIITTFAGHGAYALGIYWPTPAHFYGMTRVILGIDQNSAKIFLLIVGILDFVICVGILLPWTRRACLLYAAIWGFLTALARPVAGMAMDLNFFGADRYLHESILRTPHFIIPLFLFFLWKKSPDSDQRNLTPKTRTI
jgi:hypothetical protein